MGVNVGSKLGGKNVWDENLGGKSGGKFGEKNGGKPQTVTSPVFYNMAVGERRMPYNIEMLGRKWCCTKERH